MKKYIVAIFLLLPFWINAQTISTYAHPIYDPNGLAFDNQGNLYVATCLGNQIKKIDTAGIITVIAGTGGTGFSGDGGQATDAMLAQPVGLTVDSLGNVIVADNQNHRIRKITKSTGIISTIIGNNLGGFAGDSGLASAATLNYPSSVVFDQFGNLYIADVGNRRIRKVNTSGIINTIAGNDILGSSGDGGQATSASCYPSSIFVDHSDNLYFTQWGVGVSSVRKINLLGIITTIAGDTSAYIYNSDNIPATNAHLDANFITVNDSAEVFVSDTYNNRIRKIDNLGIIHTIAGNGIAGYSGNGSSADLAQIHKPSGIIFDHCGNLFFSEVDNALIRKVVFNTSCWPEKVPELPINQIPIYPNPSSDILNIDNLKTQTNYCLFNVFGIIKQSGILKEGNNTITITTLSPGLYLLQLTNNQGEKTVKKIIKN